MCHSDPVISKLTPQPNPAHKSLPSKQAADESEPQPRARRTHVGDDGLQTTAPGRVSITLPFRLPRPAGARRGGREALARARAAATPSGQAAARGAATAGSSSRRRDELGPTTRCDRRWRTAVDGGQSWIGGAGWSDATRGGGGASKRAPCIPAHVYHLKIGTVYQSLFTSLLTHRLVLLCVDAHCFVFWDLPGDVLAAPESALCGWIGVNSLYLSLPLSLSIQPVCAGR